MKPPRVFKCGHCGQVLPMRALAEFWGVSPEGLKEGVCDACKTAERLRKEERDG
jgi:hypothetical protein